MNRQSRETGK